MGLQLLGQSENVVSPLVLSDGASSLVSDGLGREDVRQNESLVLRGC